MPVYLSLLRGINVSGQKKIKMADLRTLYQQFGFNQVSTYIQSGNVVFSTRKRSAPTIAKSIRQGILEAYEFDVPVFVKTAKELQQAIDENPFPSVNESSDIAKLYLIFLEKTPDSHLVKALLDQTADWPDQIKIIGDRAYLYVPNGYGRTKLNNNFVERKLKLEATARNWKTVNTLLDMMTKEEN